MRFVLTGLSLLILAGCTVESMSSTPNDGSSSSTSSSGGVTSTDAGSPSVAATLPFKASNVTLAGVDASKLGDVVVAEANCTIDTESKLIGCIDNDLVAYVVVDQPGAGKIGMYVAKSVRIEPNAGLRTRGTYALAIVALDSFDVQGKIDASAQSDYESAGGFRVVGSNARGGGEGGGFEGSATNGAGGGSFCGVGGKGAAIAGGAPGAGAGGKAYGSPSLVPLVGGSAGGSGVLNGGTGGGAVQLVAGKTFTLGASALITVGGGGGGSVGAASNQHGGGGGSGGAILIEAPQATIQGTLLANGGAGGAKATGMDAAAKIDGMRATSDELLHGSGGGEGSGNANDNGSDATWFDGDNAPAGGGGAGRIRVNTLTGNTALSAKVLSPSANGQCTTEGTLAP